MMTDSGTIMWRAKRRFSPGHISEGVYTHTFGAVTFERASDIERADPRSGGGSVEPVYTRADQLVTVTIGPVTGPDVLILDELCASIVTGQVFQARPFGDEREPMLLKVLTDAIEVRRVVRTGQLETDWYTADIVAVEAEADADDGDGVDIYSPAVGGPMGGADIPPIIDVIEFQPDSIVLAPGSNVEHIWSGLSGSDSDDPKYIPGVIQQASLVGEVTRLSTHIYTRVSIRVMDLIIDHGATPTEYRVASVRIPGVGEYFTNPLGMAVGGYDANAVNYHPVIQGIPSAGYRSRYYWSSDAGVSPPDFSFDGGEIYTVELTLAKL